MARLNVGGNNMIHICAILLIICICEGIAISYFLKSKKENLDIEEKISFFRDFWGKFVFYVIATSVIGLFLGSIYFEKIVGLNEINAWVGIVLGLVALIIGIISLFLSFYNVDQANRTQEKTVEIIQTFQENMIEHMHKLQLDVERKIEESSEKTRNEIRTMYNDTSEFTIKKENSDPDWNE
jgi:ABC-type multidrug transport system fused ATPase/permease subunit